MCYMSSVFADPLQSFRARFCHMKSERIRVEIGTVFPARKEN
jgi:hypothetical protein